MVVVGGDATVAACECEACGDLPAIELHSVLPLRMMQAAKFAPLSMRSLDPET